MNSPDKIILRQAREREISFIEKALSESDLPAESIAEKKSCFYLGWIGDEPTAIGALEPAGQNALLRSILVLPDKRGEGYGRQFCELLIKEARGLDFRGLYLLTTTAELFFAQLGFKKTDRASVPERIGATDEFSRICPDSAICMFLDIQ